METATSADGTTLAFDVVGSGPALVLVPGATCTRGVSASLAEALSADFTVFNVDRRGRGASNDLSVRPPYETAREVEDVAAVIAAAGGSAAVYGHSSGAGLAIRAAAAEIGVTKLVMHDAPYNLPGNEGHGIDWDARLNAMLDSGRPGDAIEAFFQMVGMPEEMINNMKRGPAWASFEAVAPTLAYDSAAMGDLEGGLVPVDLFPRVQMPTLVLVGGADHGFMTDVAHLLVDGLPDPHFHHLLGARHDAGPDVVAPPVKRFLLD